DQVVAAFMYIVKYRRVISFCTIPPYNTIDQYWSGVCVAGVYGSTVTLRIVATDDHIGQDRTAAIIVVQCSALTGASAVYRDIPGDLRIGQMGSAVPIKYTAAPTGYFVAADDSIV